MLWCVGIGEKHKRSNEDDDTEREPGCKRIKPTDTNADSLKSNTKEYELQLKAKHGDALFSTSYGLRCMLKVRTTP